MTDSRNQAPGRPGEKPTWTSSAKEGIGTALSSASNVWLTLRSGVLTEVYYPVVDRPCLRNLVIVVTDRRDFFSDEQSDTEHELSMLGPGVPAYRIVNRCKQERYQIEKTILSDPDRPVVLQEIGFTPLRGSLSDYGLYVLVSPHLADEGEHNTGWVADYKGTTLLYAARTDHVLALGCSVPWKQRSAGYVGVSDGWQDLRQHKRMTWQYERAEDGNVALTGEVDLEKCAGRFVLALGFGASPAEAGLQVRGSLFQGFAAAQQHFVRAWSDWQARLFLPEPPAPPPGNLDRMSATVIRCHESKRFPGAILASLSIPWGSDRGDKQRGGYHLVWPRDLVETAGAKLALGDVDGACRVLFYLRLIQDADGHWPQNVWINGKPYLESQQMDETGLVILLAGLLHRQRALTDAHLRDLWPMLRQAARYLVQNGPVSKEDRWEEDAGYSVFTLAVEVAALLQAADFAEAEDEGPLAPYLRETADAWSAAIDRWLYARDTDLARQLGIDGYYVRMTTPDEPGQGRAAAGTVPNPNRRGDESSIPARRLVSPDALALVRYGLRAADDPRIENTVRAIDATLKVDTPRGPTWHRYTQDGYGEHEDGSPFDGTGIGRGWPLLTGERGHFELAAGRKEEAERLLRAMESFTCAGGLLPEQVWDTRDIPERGLFMGHPSGSAMPLVWAHAEHLKLRRSLNDGRVFDMPPQTRQRYVVERTGSPHLIWRYTQKVCTLPQGKTLRLEVLMPARAHWTMDGKVWKDTPLRASGWGTYFVDLPTEQLPAGVSVQFAFHWTEGRRKEDSGFRVAVVAPVT